MQHIITAYEVLQLNRYEQHPSAMQSPNKSTVSMHRPQIYVLPQYPVELLYVQVDVDVAWEYGESIYVHRSVR